MSDETLRPRPTNGLLDGYGPHNPQPLPPHADDDTPPETQQSDNPLGDYIVEILDRSA